MTAEGWSLFVAAVLVVLAAFLVAGETAFGRVSIARVDELQREGEAGAVRLRVLLDDRARYVNVLLFLHTLLFVSATVLVTRAFLELVPGDVWWRLVASALVMVVLGFVALGVAPRTLGVQHADRIALRTAGLARALAVLLGPITSLLILVGNALTPGRGFKRGPFASQAELRELVDLAGASDLIEDDERQMIHSVFELGDTTARELMVPRTEMVFVETTKTLRQAISLALRSGFSRIPVVGENVDDIVGVVYLKDLVRRTFEHHEAENSERVASLMRSVFMVPDSKRADDLLRDMQAARTHLAVLVDEYGGTAGIVTIEDVVEEIVGEIADEYDTEVPEVEKLAHGSYRVHARMHVDDFADLVGIDIDGEEEGVDTVGGLLALRLGRVPIPGARITVDGWDLTAESAAGRRNRIGTVLAEPVVPVEDDDEDEGSDG
ncbi:hemolysin family protein [Longivirga aurantiaca]|uniref:Hemolysin family protein n=1 Tax=Longivirga aurantiaca TaxID=1837743 RepID=A0ABW1T445_9ACTN